MGHTQGWYDNKRLIVTALLDKIFGGEPVKNETANAVKKLHDTVSENIRVLRSMILIGINQVEIEKNVVLISAKIDKSHKDSVR